MNLFTCLHGNLICGLFKDTHKLEALVYFSIPLLRWRFPPDTVRSFGNLSHVVHNCNMHNAQPSW